MTSGPDIERFATVDDAEEVFGRKVADLGRIEPSVDVGEPGVDDVAKESLILLMLRLPFWRVQHLPSSA
ncbi:MAG TPA: hypothetical protein VN682_19870 [Terriglobales bacterium]|nr:hypothetical protein [Terriglobales bacterium]